MKRNCIKLDFPDLVKEHPELRNSKVEVWIDRSNKNEIYQFLQEQDRNGKTLNRKKFRTILYWVLLGKYSDDLYGKEEVSPKAKFVTAMKFKRKGANIRIVCKEFFVSGKKVVMICCFHKKTNKNDKKAKDLYESVGEYEYEFKIGKYQ
jgi:hypothetical protein